MRMRRVTFVTTGVAVAGLILCGGTMVAGAQNENDHKNNGAGAPAVGQGSKKPDTADRQKLQAELDDLLKQRADLDRRIAEKRGKLGVSGQSRHRFEFRNGDGPPQIFEFNGDGSGNLPPEARKQIDEAQKRQRDVFGNMQFDNFPNFDFQFDGETGPDGIPDMKAFQDRMRKWSQEFRDRMQLRSNGLPGQKPQDAKPDKGAPNKPTTSRPKIYDA